MQPDYHQKHAQLAPGKRNKWIQEQRYIRKQIEKKDCFEWTVNTLRLIAGVDVSFSGRYENGACAALLIYDALEKKIVYEDYEYVVLKEDYVPGFLAFRELPPTLQLFRKLKARAPKLWPQLIMVDGNGVLHKYECGYASHLGVVLDIPSIGCAKTFFDVDGLHQNEVQDFLNEKLVNRGDNVVIKGNSGKQWCTAILANEDHNNHIYVSIGTKISLSTATAIVLKHLADETAIPVQYADRNSRRRIKQMRQIDYDSARAYDMHYLS